MVLQQGLNIRNEFFSTSHLCSNQTDHLACMIENKKESFNVIYASEDVI